MARTIERSIYFYKVEPMQKEDGSTQVVDLDKSLTKVGSLPFDMRGRYLELTDGTILCCWPDHVRSPQRGRIARIRRTDLPQLEEAGSLSPLQIPARSGLAEQMHFVAFADGIVGCEFNFYGPRASRLAYYLSTRAPEAGEFLLEPLLRLDVTEQLAKLKNLRLFSIKVRASYTQTLKQLNEDLGVALDALVTAGSAEVLEVTLRPKGRTNILKKTLLTLTKKVAKRPDARGEMKRFVVRGESMESGNIEEVDVLSDMLISKKRIVAQDESTRAVNTEAAYAAVREAYAELKGELRDAAGLPSAN